jgi:hypothetical protein
VPVFNPWYKSVSAPGDIVSPSAPNDMHRLRIILFLAAALAVAYSDTPSSAGEGRNDGPYVVLFMIDGLRVYESVEDPAHDNIPHMWNELRPQGAFIPNFRNEGQTKTNPGHASVLTGTWQQIANNGSERPTEPTLFEYYRKHTGAPEHDAWIVSGKSKLDALAYSTHEDYGKEYGASETTGLDDDNEVYEVLIETLERDRPSLVMACFPDVDLNGHDNDWDAYLGAVHNVDSLAAECWAYLQSSPHYAGKTYMFITSDHGRHDDEAGGFRNHGCPGEGCQRLTFFALGPGIRPGFTVSPDSVYTQRDLCNTVAKILDIPVERSEGRVIGDIFQPPPASPGSAH